MDDEADAAGYDEPHHSEIDDEVSFALSQWRYVVSSPELIVAVEIARQNDVRSSSRSVSEPPNQPVELSHCCFQCIVAATLDVD